MLSIMSFRDGTGNVSVVLIGMRDEYLKNLITAINTKDKFRVNGNMEEDIYLVYDKLNNIIGTNVIKKDLIKNKVLFITAIQKVEHKKSEV